MYFPASYIRGRIGTAQHTYLDGVKRVIKNACGLGQWASLHSDAALTYHLPKWESGLMGRYKLAIGKTAWARPAFIGRVGRRFAFTEIAFQIFAPPSEHNQRAGYRRIAGVRYHRPIVG
ncbi:hypothetical protein KSP40_PGU015461 [Platanthera guangdongensis]|uniref:Uncharacterized protein n=1 Tax=Platanthera guangdongensis TaxID=2320717 RepID=A0ABR2MEI0_9ASPA